MDVSPLTHTFATAANSLWNGLGVVWRRTSFPIVFGTHGKYNYKADAGSAVAPVILDGLSARVGEYSGETYGKQHKIMVPVQKAADMKEGEKYIAICLPFHVRKTEVERTLLLPIIRVW